MKLLLIILGLLLFLSACNPHIHIHPNHAMMGHPQITSEAMFIAEMIPHHQEAVETSLLMLTSENVEVRNLAELIIFAQETEISMMQGWLNDWYADSEYKSTYKNMMPELHSLEGDAKDIAYLKGMIHHHQGAIEMAKQVQAFDIRPEVQKLATDIISVQEIEIAQMTQLLQQYE